MPKYKANYPLEAYNAWMQWIDSLDDMMTLPQEWNWPLNKLLSAEKIKPGANDRAVPASLLDLRDKETQETRQVNFVFFSKSNGNYPVRFLYSIFYNYML